MSKISTIEQIEALFMPTAFEIVKKQNPDIDDIDALSLSWKILWSASDLYDEAIENGQTESQALSIAFDLFSNTYQSIAS
ncbi:hypothetical protein E2605_19035 [Dysgonomonas capnocytophagoides]|uniref:Uncharacterized protein n=1 Tax=Dysgonomonas capnocytophagoides TaxID=45254 RepID=A0A4Y8KUK9_9BACT|nr:hypothetical protein [Dysgonomonas capnocytophagoides]TFD91934.1 hypothetical protein E2605_19035 [Dysgonomonas capnocytophagoides]